ncbi:MAG: LptF/LptG family permease [Capsulimonadales bacterium]|nr:LptF/LptG family permease [Capsulimonadales bacterium]
MNSMRIADRSILIELLTFFLVSTLAVLILLVGIAVLFQQESWEYLPYSIPWYLSLTLPVAIALAASLQVNRMARDHEVTVLRSAGTPLYRAFLPIFVVGFLVSVVDYVLFDRVLPWGQQQLTARFGQAAEETASGNAFAVDRFTVAYSGSERLSAAKRRLFKVVLIESPSGEGTPTRVTTAMEADYENGNWQMRGVVRLTFDHRGVTSGEERRATDTIRLPVDFSTLYRRPDSAQIQYAFSELIVRAREAERFGNRQDAIAYETDAWTKLALPSMALVFTLFGVPLSLRFARTGSFSGVMLSIGTVFVAWNTLLLMQYVGYGGWLPPFVAAWATNILFGVPGLVLLWFAER